MSIGMNVVGLLELVHVVVEVGSSIDNKERREHQQQSSESSGHPGEFVDGPQYPRVQLLGRIGTDTLMREVQNLTCCNCASRLPETHSVPGVFDVGRFGRPQNPGHQKSRPGCGQGCRTPSRAANSQQGCYMY
jgi:hypothetical protein